MVKLSETVKQYCESKEEEKTLKKKLSGLSSEIKEQLNADEETKFEAGDWVVELQNKVSEDIDEAKLVSFIQRYWAEKGKEEECPYIQYVPVINMEALEKDIYNKNIPEDILNAIQSCRITKETQALIYKRAKKEN